MKRPILFLLLSLNAIATVAQEAPPTKEFKTKSIERLSTLIIDNYVFPEVGQACADHIQKKLKAGGFDSVTTIGSFTKVLTSELQSINHDKHMRVRANGLDGRPNRPRPEGTGGFKESKVFEGN